jgi:hypothetical protein
MTFIEDLVDAADELIRALQHLLPDLFPRLLSLLQVPTWKSADLSRLSPYRKRK